MKKVIQTVSEKGQINIPVQFRKLMSLGKGDKEVMSVDERSNDLTVSKAGKDPIKKLRGYLSGQGVTLADMLRDKRNDIGKEG